MINERIFLKKPLNFKGKCMIYPPSIDDILDNDKFSQYRMIITMSQEDLEDLIYGKETMTADIQSGVLSPLEFLLNNCYNNEKYRQLTEEAFYFFTHKQIDFSWNDKKIFLFKLEEEITKASSIEDIKKLPTIEENEFFEFQNLVRQSMGEKKVEPPKINEDPRIKRMKAKARYRDRIKAKNGQGISLGTSLASICCMGLGLTPLNIGQMSYAAINGIMQTYQNKEKFDLDTRSLMAGADSKKIKPKYWIRNLDD